jgi:hypothetical protein
LKSLLLYLSFSIEAKAVKLLVVNEIPRVPNQSLSLTSYIGGPSPVSNMWARVARSALPSPVVQSTLNYRVQTLEPRHRPPPKTRSPLLLAAATAIGRRRDPRRSSSGQRPLARPQRRPRAGCIGDEGEAAARSTTGSAGGVTGSLGGRDASDSGSTLRYSSCSFRPLTVPGQHPLSVLSTCPARRLHFPLICFRSVMPCAASS